MSDGRPGQGARAWHVGVQLAGLVIAMSVATSARAQVRAPAAVLDHPVTKGQLLSAADFTMGTVGEAQARSALRTRDAIGMEAARDLASGSIVRTRDLLQPQLVRRGEQVLIVLRNRTLLITSTGRALGNAAAGEPVRVVATATNHTLDAVADGPGSVHVPF